MANIIIYKGGIIIGEFHHRIPKYAVSIPISFLLVLTILCPSIYAQDESITGIVTDIITNEPIAGANVTVIHIDTENLYRAVTDANGYFEVTGLSYGNYTVLVEAEGYLNQSYDVEIKMGVLQATRPLTVTLTPISTDKDEKSIFEEFLFSVVFRTILIVIIILVISLVMYSKIKRKNLLQNAQRKRIYDYIRENPGKHYRAILNDLELPMGVLTYHLNRLEKAQYLTSRQDGMFRRFYLKSPKTDMRLFLSDIQKSILNVIKENKGISQTKIAEKIGVSRKVVNYHVGILDQAGLILVESHGRESACFSLDTTPVEATSD